MQPIIQGSVIKNAHPQGCADYLHHKWQSLQGLQPGRFRHVLILGASSGFGLAARLVTLAQGASHSVGLSFERPAKGDHSASAGWYLNEAYQHLATKQGQHHATFNQDAFLPDSKMAVVGWAKQHNIQFDLVLYSLAAGVKIAEDGEKIRSTIAPIGQHLTGFNVDFANHNLVATQVAAADEQQVKDTVAIMGGSDWQDWLTTLQHHQCLSPDCTSYNLSYLGGELNQAIYRQGTLGVAKAHMHQAAKQLREQGLNAWPVVCKALVTKASAFIPTLGPYLMALKPELAKRNWDEDVFAQMRRLFTQGAIKQEDALRLDNYELDPEVQTAVAQRLANLDPETFTDTLDYWGIRKELLAMHGFVD